MLMYKRVLACAGWVALAAFVLVGTALVLWPEEQNASPAGPPDPTSPDPAPPEVAADEPPPGPPVADPPVVVPSAAEDGGGPAPCAGCLTERAVLDVVETYLRYLDPVHLQGGIWAQPLADVATEKPGLVRGLPKLPPGLLEAPEFNPFGVTVDTRSYPVETTWLVWLQTGWVPRRAIEQRIRSVTETPDGRTFSGDLPEVALSWPPIKKETFVAVDGRTGEIRSAGIFRMTSQGQWPPYPPHYDAVLEATRQRADHWLRKERQTRSP